MTTWTIDDMPESERPKRNIFRRHTEMHQPAPTHAAPAPQPPAAAQAQPVDLTDYLHKSDLDRFRILIMDALAGFPAARASVLEAVKQAFQQMPPEGSPA